MLIAWGMGIDRMDCLRLAALITALAALNHRCGLLPAIEDVGRHSYGTVAYGAADHPAAVAVLAGSAPPPWQRACW